MKQHQRLNLEKYRKLIRVKNQPPDVKDLLREQAEVMTGAIIQLAQTLESIKELSKQNVVIENNIDLEEIKRIAESIPKQEAPVVNVRPNINVAPVVLNEDIYSRYKRANSVVEKFGTYHGFIDSEGNWFIQLESGSNDKASTRYAVGKGDFLDKWPKRKNLEYKLLNEVTIV